MSVSRFSILDCTLINSHRLFSIKNYLKVSCKFVHKFFTCHESTHKVHVFRSKSQREHWYLYPCVGESLAINGNLTTKSTMVLNSFRMFHLFLFFLYLPYLFSFYITSRGQACQQWSVMPLLQFSSTAFSIHLSLSPQLSSLTTKANPTAGLRGQEHDRGLGADGLLLHS